MKVALVTGAARRIGAAIASHLHDNDWHVIIHCHHSLAAAENLADGLNQRRPDSAKVIRADLSDPDDLQTMEEQCSRLFGQLNLLVNNASEFYPTPIDQITPQSFDALMATNVKAPLLLATRLARQLRGGSIINIIDIHGEKPLKDYLIYGMSKAALGMLTRSLALELAPDVRVNGVAPGAILWPEDTAEMQEAEKQNLLSHIPLSQLGSPSDIARAVRFLADDAPFITGQIISADGGQSI